MKQPISATVDKEIKERLEKEALEKDRSLSYIINERLKKGYEPT